MTKKIIKALIFLSIVGVSSSALACMNDVKKKQVQQNRQIKKGVKEDRIDAKEFRKLKKKQRKVSLLRKRALSNDGIIDRKEARKIARVQRKQARRIKNFKNTSR